MHQILHLKIVNRSREELNFHRNSEELKAPLYRVFRSRTSATVFEKASSLLARSKTYNALLNPGTGFAMILASFIGLVLVASCLVGRCTHSGRLLDDMSYFRKRNIEERRGKRAERLDSEKLELERTIAAAPPAIQVPQPALLSSSPPMDAVMVDTRGYG